MGELSDKRGRCSKQAEGLINPLEDHSAIVRDVQGVRASQPGVTAAIGVLTLIFTRDRKRRPRRVPELTVNRLMQVEVAKIVKSCPAAKVEHGKVVAALTS